MYIYIHVRHTTWQNICHEECPIECHMVIIYVRNSASWSESLEESIYCNIYIIIYIYRYIYKCNTYHIS